MKFKSKNDIDYSAYLVCEEYNCKEESTRIWAGKELSIMDLCDKHYEEAIKENF